MSALRRNASQTVAATNMAAIHKQNQIFSPFVGATLGSREGAACPSTSVLRTQRYAK